MALHERGPQGPAGPPGRLVVPGEDGYVLYNNGGVCGATNELQVTDDGIEHTGEPIHKEDVVHFRKGATLDGPLSDWDVLTTTNATPATLLTTTVPIATYGNCRISIMAEVTCSYAAGGGSRSIRASFKRVSGTLTRVFHTDTSDADHWEGTVLGDIEIDVSTNEVILTTVTGIAATDIRHVISAHVQVAALPS